MSKPSSRRPARMSFTAAAVLATFHPPTTFISHASTFSGCRELSRHTRRQNLPLDSPPFPARPRTRAQALRRRRLRNGRVCRRTWFNLRVGQKNKITRRWAKRGTRPSAPNDQRTASAYIFGAICPAEGKGAGVLPSCNSEATALHLAEISLAVAPGAHALVLLDQAGWHVSKKLPIPGNITLVPLPPTSPELNPVENIWQFMRDNWLSNRVFKSYDDILDHCCFAWNKLIDMPWKIMSIGTRDWVYRS
jgi:transposase